jgi:hypothetical protein
MNKLLNLGEFTDDASSKPGAERLADRIMIYWRARGYRGISAGAIETAPPKGLTVHNPKSGKSQNDHRPIFQIVSNIGQHGFPPLKAA